MNDNETRYLDLVAEIMEELDNVHKNSRKYMRRTLVAMVIVPVVLILVIVLIGASKITTLFFWLAFIFAACAFLVFLEYTDTTLKRKVESFVGGEEEMAEIQERIEQHKVARAEAAEAARIEREALEDAEADAADEEEAEAKAKRRAHDIEEHPADI